MEILYIFYFTFLVFIIFIMIVITMFHFYYINYEEKAKKLDEKYKDMFINYSFDEKYNFNFELKEIDYVKNAAVSLMTSFTGKIRRGIINFCDEKGIVDHVYKMYNKTNRRVVKRLLLHDMGQLRSKTHFNELLNEDIDDLMENELILAYFLSLLLIVEEWLFELDKEILKQYIDKLVNIINEVSRHKRSKMKRILDYFYNRTDKLFTYLLDYPEEKNYFLMKVFEKGISLEAKGAIIYVMSVNHQYSIADYVKEEFYKYIDKEKKQPNEIDYLVNLVKSSGELKSDDAFSIMEKASSSDVTVLKIICSKYLEFYENGSEVMYQLLFDKVWYVRYNAALAFTKMEDKGIKYLIKVLNSDDRYAREISAYAIGNSYYGKEIIKNIENGKIEQVREEINLIINRGNSLKVLDMIFRNKKIKLEDKLRILDIVSTIKITDYYNNILSNFHVEEELTLKIEEKIQNIFKEVIL